MLIFATFLIIFRKFCGLKLVTCILFIQFIQYIPHRHSVQVYTRKRPKFRFGSGFGKKKLEVRVRQKFLVRSFPSVCQEVTEIQVRDLAGLVRQKKSEVRFGFGKNSWFGCFIVHTVHRTVYGLRCTLYSVHQGSPTFCGRWAKKWKNYIPFC